MYTQKKFGYELTLEIEKNCSMEHLSEWAHEKYLMEDTDAETSDSIMTIMALDEGEEFELNKEELLQFAANLQI